MRFVDAEIADHVPTTGSPLISLTSLALLAAISKKHAFRPSSNLSRGGSHETHCFPVGLVMALVERDRRRSAQQTNQAPTINPELLLSHCRGEAHARLAALAGS
jgi:hypothetical protein